MGNPHILVIPYPAQGHVIPLMELSRKLTKHGFKITFVNTDFNHERVVDAFANKPVYAEVPIQLVSIPDGMGIGEDRNDLGKLTDGISQVMPGKLKELIKKINRFEDDKISCVIADVNMGMAIEVAAELGIPGVAFWPASAFLLALIFSSKRLLDDQVIDEHGTPINKEKMIRLYPNTDTPTLPPNKILWVCLGDFRTQKICFEFAQRNNEAIAKAEWLICNTTSELEPATLGLIPEILPIGPVSVADQDFPGSFWPEDATCLEWLDQQGTGSVIYVAFGSFTIFDPTQFRELALGLELSNMPFLWVVRPDITEGTESDDVYPKGFKERVAKRGRMVGWAPQRAVLAHPSIACFISHCGWNSTIEGVSNGVPFLCWPYFADQFVDESYICEIWKIGLNFKRDERGIISREEIKNKVEQLLGDEGFKERSLELKELVLNSVYEGGSSDRNFNNFIGWIKS